ncbi:hypothetical protein Smp_137030 [Schistosoma mansoni]|uniref:hypothetical protein n=1 Tax=Schistosoma mansoni TaxID=6183 RepID=UPI0001A64627|nr:hypothetical protein Smp_137030 [Schistosoma mansoni]|eukprot:XP_018651773.1 hypothetical protein Smp_137030 [Schistosoma mansoni]
MAHWLYQALHRAPKAHALYVNHVLKQGLPLISMHAEQLPENELLSLNALNVNTVIDPNMQDHQLPSVLESFSFTEANIYTDENLLFVPPSKKGDLIKLFVDGNRNKIIGYMALFLEWANMLICINVYAKYLHKTI